MKSIELPPLYARTAKGAITIWKCWAEGDEVKVRWGQLDGAQQDAAFKCTPKNEGRANATTAEEQAVKEAQAKWEKQKRKKYYDTVGEAMGATAIKPMLAQSWDKHGHKMAFPATAQPKLDGLRCLARWEGNDIYLQSRGVGDPYGMDHVKEVLRQTLPRDAVLDGELYSHGMSLQEINSLVRRPRYPDPNEAATSMDIGSRAITYCVYDAPCVPSAFYSGEAVVWEIRMQWLYQFHAEAQIPWHVVWPVPSVAIDGPEAAKLLHDKFVEEGYEGAIIRHHQGEYRSGYRSPHLLKMKQFDDDEFVVVGWARGKGKFINVPTFDCRTKDGEVFSCTPVGTEKARLQMLADADASIGKMMKVRYMGYTPYGKPFHPVALGIREKRDM